MDRLHRGMFLGLLVVGLPITFCSVGSATASDAPACSATTADASTCSATSANAPAPSCSCTQPKYAKFEGLSDYVERCSKEMYNSAGKQDDSCCKKDDCCCCQDNWYVRADALFVHRDNASINQPVVIRDDTGATVLTPQSINFDWDVGERVFLGQQNCCEGIGWEIGYFGVNGRTASASATDPNNLDIPLPLASVANDFDNADKMTLTWNWSINNAEFNVFHRVGWAQFLLGFRYFNLAEHFNINAVDSDGDSSDYPISVNNNLFGGQIGARVQHDWNRFGINITGKAGVFGNEASEHQSVFDNNNTTTLRSAGGTDGTVAFVGDVDLAASYKLCDHVSFIAGYYLLWATNVALAPDQLDFSFNSDSGTTVHDRGTLFVNGATAGVKVTW